MKPNSAQTKPANSRHKAAQSANPLTPSSPQNPAASRTGRRPKSPSKRLLSANWKLTEASKQDSISALIEAASELFSSPIILVDEHFRILASYPKDPEQISELRFMIHNCCLNERVIWEVLKEHTSPESDFYEPFYTDEGICSGEPLILGELVHKDGIYGHLMICIGQRPLGEDDLELTSLILHMMQLQLAGRSKLRAYWGQTMSERLKELLSAGTPQHILDASVKAIAASVSGRYAVLAAPASHWAAQRALTASSIEYLQQKYPNVVLIYHAHCFVALIGETRYTKAEPILRPDNNRTVRKLFEYFEQYGLRPALSSSFQDLYQTHCYYQQALIAARLSEELNLKARAVFLDLMPLPIFSTLLRANLGYSFVHPVFFQIRKHDREYGTEYEKTLCSYLLHLEDKEQTAADLNVHKNTVQYRLLRIEELFDLPLSDTQTALNLLCSALLLQISPETGDRDAQCRKAMRPACS